MEEALLQKWEEEFSNVTEHAADAKTLFFVELVHADFKLDLKIGDETEKIEVIRWQFPLLHGMLRTAYSAQGLTLDGGAVLDLRRAREASSLVFFLCRGDREVRLRLRL